jgi:NAD-dependent deacetylase sirtuin 2
MSGAGISTAAGIPDFRSPKTGLYHQLEKYNLPYAEAIFTLDYFKENPKPFCILAKELYPTNFHATPCHYFVKLLEDKGLLLRNYTQNIDTLERSTGISPDKLIEAHGSFGDASCIDCEEKYTADFVKDILFKDGIPKCLKCKGLVKPEITFFGESLPEKFGISLLTDKSKADLLLVLGTSLQVFPFASIVNMVSDDIPRVLINMESVGLFKRSKDKRDVNLLGDCQVTILELVTELGWMEDFEKLIPKDCKPYQDAVKNLKLK